MEKISGSFTFNGECREALTFYKDCFGGELTFMTMADTPMKDKTPPEKLDLVIHGELNIGSTTIMGSDHNMGEVIQGNAVQLCIHCTSEDEITRYFNNLARGGKIIDPLGIKFWGDMFGVVLDKYEKYWLLNYSMTGKTK